jgi:hypothetical protein
MARNERADKKAQDLRGVLVTLGALGLSIGVLFSIGGAVPTRPSKIALGPTTTTTTTTTTAHNPAGSSTTTTVAKAGTKVAVLAPTGAPLAASVESKLTRAGDSLVSHAAIPSSWVSNLHQPVVRYPYGYFDQAVGVARALGLNSNVVGAEASGTSDGADVIEVFVPAS